jgi:hypothetical protein
MPEAMTVEQARERGDVVRSLVERLNAAVREAMQCHGTGKVSQGLPWWNRWLRCLDCNGTGKSPA